ncbi:MAG TPA: DUF5658 family protein [Candidatus Limnocylindria bacterium]|nr:DUF5658 family protein [Candidatus Limnocylindria bacterium]
MNTRTERGLFALLILNVALQVFDGVATYHGLGLGFGEGNPLLVHAMTSLGPAAALILTKLYACGCLLGVWRIRHARLALPALVIIAAVYATCSLAPWSAALAQAHFDRLQLAQL